MTSRVPLDALRLQGDVRAFVDHLAGLAGSWFASRLAEHPEIEPQAETARRLWLDGYGWHPLLSYLQEEELLSRMSAALSETGRDDHVRLRDATDGSFRLLGAERERPPERFIQYLKAGTSTDA
jgi:hypothetical protein